MWGHFNRFTVFEAGMQRVSGGEGELRYSETNIFHYHILSRLRAAIRNTGRYDQQTL